MGALKEVADLGQTCVVSPHFDDAVLSCADLISGVERCLVLTVFSDGPETAGKISDWDRACGFSVGDDVMVTRATEDAAALVILRATPASLGFSEYRASIPLWARAVIARVIRFVRSRHGSAELAMRIADALTDRLEQANATSCAFPLGVYHFDHRLTTLACLEVARRLPGVHWLVYEDMPYTLESPQRRAAALRRIRAAGFTLEPLTIELSNDAERKRAAVGCYDSQLRGLGDRVQPAISAAERYHRLTPRVATPAE